MAKRSSRKAQVQSLADKLAALPDLPLDGLKEQWETLYGNSPPSRLGRTMMVRGIAYRLQEQIYGGLKPVTRRRLMRTAEEIHSGRAPSSPITLKPGTRLLREWQGVTHEVIILEKGVQYRDKTWTSLSAVAREITGTRWSGPLFFGLKGQRNGKR